MIEWIALILSIINSILWVVFAVAIRKIFKALAPMLNAMGLMGGISVVENLTKNSEAGKMEFPPIISEAEKPK